VSLTNKKLLVEESHCPMKNRKEKLTITKEDMNSFFFLKAFLKLIRFQSLPVFCLKVLACGLGFIGLLFFLLFIGEYIQ
jgi:hypothetical protein